MTWNLDVEHTLRGAQVVKRYICEKNGLKLLLLPDPSAPIISYQTWYDVGSADETPGKTGLAHFFEHLMFTQTARHGPGVFDRMIESCGGDTNAATWLDWTYYRDSVPASELGLAVGLEADRMDGLVLTRDIVESEREVIINERRERVDDDVDGFLDEQLMHLAFGGHPYGWPTIGWMQDIENLSIDDLRVFYRRFYAPDKATIIVVGDFDEAAALRTIGENYAHLEPGDQQAATGSAPVPSPTARRIEFNKPVAADRALYGWTTPGQGTREWAVLELVSHILSGGPSARLHKRLVVEDELASSTSCSMLPLKRAGFFEVAVHSNSDHDVSDNESAVDEIMDDLRSALVSPEELEKAKLGMLTDFWSEMTTADGKAESLGHHELVCGDFRELMAFPDVISSVTADEIRNVCESLLAPDQRFAVTASPE